MSLPQFQGHVEQIEICTSDSPEWGVGAAGGSLVGQTSVKKVCS